MYRPDVLPRRETISVVCTLGGESGREDGKVGNFHGIAVEYELADAGDHVGQHALDGAFGIRGVMVGHVLGELLQADGLVDHRAAEPLAVGLARLGFVLIDFVV